MEGPTQTMAVNSDKMTHKHLLAGKVYDSKSAREQ